MWQRLILGVILAIAAYFVIQYFSTEGYTNYDMVIETPAQGPYVREPVERGSYSVSSSGPNPPNAEAPRNMPKTRSPPPEASDPYSESAEDADAPERLRHPERSFSPGIIPEQTSINEGAGLAANPVSSPQAFQTFSPDFVQNGGSFFGTVSAMEDENPNYSAF